VDDNEYNRIVVRDTLLSKADVSLSLATNGKEAVELAAQIDFDVVLMDVQMPVMDGYEATRYIRDPQSNARDHHIPVIALTASVVRSDLDKCRQAGMNDYVPKPFKTSQLISAIAQATGREIRYVEGVQPVVEKQTGPGPGITDLTYLRNFCDGDQARMEKYIKIFVDSAPGLVDKLNAAMAVNDVVEIADQVHGYKTKWIMMGMTGAKELALKIEMECRREEPVPSYRSDVEQLLRQINRAVIELNAL
jgi:CheY-like chemotaxis protein/HPt (histidine-containing phosphotransfer) domain-containing protein